MICPICGSHMAVVDRKLSYECLYSGCPNQYVIYYPCETVAWHNDVRVVRCPVCLSLAEVLESTEDTVTMRCTICGTHTWDCWQHES